jgi:hypothetical protein
MRVHTKRVSLLAFVLSAVGLAFTTPAIADDGSSCAGLPTQDELHTALVSAVATEISGLNHHMWASIVNRNGFVCAVAFSGANLTAQWPGSRVISAQKANTANGFSLDSSSSSNGSGEPAGLALSTANLYAGVQPGGSAFELGASNPVDPAVAYSGNANKYGTKNDPMIGNRIGGVSVIGGGLGLYAAGHVVVGGLGLSGDTSCADHFISWRVRNLLGLDHMAATASLPAVPGPASIFAGDATHPDNIIFDITPNPNGGTGNSASGFGHPTCVNTGNPAALPAVRP